MVAISKSRVKQRQLYTRKEKKQEKVMLTVLMVLVGIYGLLKVLNSSTGDDNASGGLAARLKKLNDHRPHLKLQSKSQPMLSESYNAIAQDILSTLKCEELFNRTTNDFNQRNEMMYDDGVPPAVGEGENEQINQRRRRRLQEDGGATQDDGDDSLRKNNEQVEENMENTDDIMPQGDDLAGWNGYEEITAKHLFCLAAGTATLKEENMNRVKDRISCDATASKQTLLLDLWSSARAQMSESLLLKTLDLAVESTRSLGQHSVNLWAPRNDDGMNFILNQVSNEEESARLNGNNFYGLSHNLGPDHLYVDVGSCLGITTLAVILQYPKTEVVSLEPAAPNWLMQELNMKCNLEDEQLPTLLMAGIGPHTKETMAAKLLWRPSAVTATRAWTPAAEQIKGEDEELFVQLRPWKALLAEAGIHSSRHIDVLHVDCEGCEYNLIPSLSDPEYDSIDTVMGELHWGYIPLHKLPSSKRGQLTHDRLCQHENFARTAKECCGNLQLQVRSSIPGEVLYREGNDRQTATVKDVIADGLCDDFNDWVQEHHFYDIDSDYGWFEMTSVAD